MEIRGDLIPFTKNQPGGNLVHKHKSENEPAQSISTSTEQLAKKS